MLSARAASRALMMLTTALAVAVAAPLSAFAATGTGANFGPSVVLQELHGTRTVPGSRMVIHWMPDHYRELEAMEIDPSLEHTVIDIQGTTFLVGSGVPSRVTDTITSRNYPTVSPDAYLSFNSNLLDYAWPLVTGMRAGTTTLTPVKLGGISYLRGVTKVTANECAGLKSGQRTVWLNAATLVPAHVVERRRGETTLDMRFTARGRRTGDWSPLKIVGRTAKYYYGDVRSTPAIAASKVSFPVGLPAALPSGFAFQYAGYAKSGETLGPEGSMPRSAGLVFAQWRRGLETIDFTIRGAKGTLAADWDDLSPFGTECGFERVLPVQIGAVTGHYSSGEYGPAHLWWRTGTTLYTVSGAYSRDQLAAIANSVTPLS